MPTTEITTTTTATITIANSTTVSAAVSIVGVSILGIVTPAALTGTAITFQVSADGVTYVPLYKSDGTQVSFTVAASRGIYVDPTIFAVWRYVKVVSGSAEAADRVFTLLVRPV